jgi:hypothetical protein
MDSEEGTPPHDDKGVSPPHDDKGVSPPHDELGEAGIERVEPLGFERAPPFLHETLAGLITKHKDNEYVYGRLVNYIENLLPVALDNATETNKLREERRIKLSANRDEFTSSFLQKNNYFYSPQTELFLHYDGLHFVLHNEDDIQHQILTTISSEKCLREWKHKVNKNIIKRIKERSPLNAIPESVTIQFVINALCPSIFPTRNQTKYFLTIIGECLAHKTCDNVPPLIYIFPLPLKEIIREIGNQCYTYFGLPNIFTNIKFKYYDHTYNDCRLLAIERTSGRKKIEIPLIFTKYMLDFLCVAAHYATRYGTADKFLNQCNENKLIEHALFLKKNTPESIVGKFIEKSLTLTVCSSSTIDFKNMIFLWKKYLDECGIPNIIFQEALKTFLKAKLVYDETKENFMGVTSIQLPVVSQFIKFWEENIIENEGIIVDGIISDENDELEIDEFCALFKQWTNIGKSAINDSLIIELIQHFYPDVVIEDNKYILHVKCKLWNKKVEVVNALKLFQTYQQLNAANAINSNAINSNAINSNAINSNAIISINAANSANSNANVIYEVYDFYWSLHKQNRLVSKRYFEKISIGIIMDDIDIKLP